MCRAITGCFVGGQPREQPGHHALDNDPAVRGQLQRDRVDRDAGRPDDQADDERVGVIDQPAGQIDEERLDAESVQQAELRSTREDRTYLHSR